MWPWVRKRVVTAGGYGKVPGDMGVVDIPPSGVPESKQGLGLLWCHVTSGYGLISYSPLSQP